MSQEPQQQRMVLPPDRVHPEAARAQAGFHEEIIEEVRQAIEAHDVVVVGMAQNPFPRKARRLLDGLGQRYHYLEYGSYLSSWKPRLALKMWAGWPTLPMIFVKGTLVGGFSDLKALVDSGEFQKMLEA